MGENQLKAPLVEGGQEDTVSRNRGRMFPVEATARAWNTLGQIITHIGVRAAAVTPCRRRLAVSLAGLETSHCSRTASYSGCGSFEDYRVVSEAHEETPLTPVDTAQIGLSWRFARRLMTTETEGWMAYIDQDPMVVQTQHKPWPRQLLRVRARVAPPRRENAA